jgi:hypothetical protein
VTHDRATRILTLLRPLLPSAWAAEAVEYQPGWAVQAGLPHAYVWGFDLDPALMVDQHGVVTVRAGLSGRRFLTAAGADGDDGAIVEAVRAWLLRVAA